MSNPSEDAGGGGSKTLLILGLIIGIAIGGGAVFSFLGQQAPEPVANDVNGEPKEPPKKVKELKAMDFDKLSIPVFQTRRGKTYGAGNYIIEFKLMCDPDSHEYVTKFRFALRQEILTALNKYDVMQDGSSMMIDYDKAAKAIHYAANKIVGDDKVEEVIIVNAVKVQ